MKNKPFLGLLCLVFCIQAHLLFSQQGVTRAVVIGISDYQDEEIPDLNFAHKDAAAFATWLRSSAGGQVPENQIQILLNKDATIGKIVESLGWLVEESEAKDKAIIYFSGHGDVETITKFNRGFLLTHNAPPRSYMTGGVLALRDLEDITNTLSEIGVEVVIITDACRAGKLAGSSVNGSQYTSSQLARRFANEIKILSCQPEEYSSEGEQWGGGHGAFSYHLLDGLYGLADRNNDLQVSLSEVDRYLEDHVPTEVAPLNQTPMSFGNRNTRLAFVDEDLMTKRKEKKATTLPSMAAVGGKHLTNDFLSSLDSNALELYTSFLQALEEKVFFEPAHACADTFYKQLVQEESMASLHSAIRRKFAAYLQDDAQGALNAMLKMEAEAISRSRIVLVEKYKDYPRYLKRSAELLGKEHYMYRSLVARSLFFEGLVDWFIYFLSGDEVIATRIMNKYRASLKEEPFAPHTNYYMGLGYVTLFNEPDSALHYVDIAMSQAPTWILPYTELAYFYIQKYKRFEQAKVLLEKSKLINEEHSLVLQGFAAWHYYQNQFEEAISYLSLAIQKDSINAIVRLNLGLNYLKTGKNRDAERYFLSATKIDSSLYIGYYFLGHLYQTEDRVADAEMVYQKSIKANPVFISGRKKLGVLYYRQKRFKEAKSIWLDAHLLKPKDIDLCYNLATVLLDLDEKKQTIIFLEKAFENGLKDYKEVVIDFDALKEIETYQDLLKKHIPNEKKD